MKKPDEMKITIKLSMSFWGILKLKLLGIKNLHQEKIEVGELSVTKIYYKKKK